MVRSYCIGQSAAKIPKWNKVQRLSKPNNKYNSYRENKVKLKYLHEGSRVGLIIRSGGGLIFNNRVLIYDIVCLLLKDNRVNDSNYSSRRKTAIKIHCYDGQL